MKNFPNRRSHSYDKSMLDGEFSERKLVVHRGLESKKPLYRDSSFRKAPTATYESKITQVSDRLSTLAIEALMKTI